MSFDSSLTLSAFYRAVTIKSGVLSSLPYKLYKKTSTGRVEIRPSEHPVARMFSKKVNSKMTKTVFLERAMGAYDIHGNHFALINFNGVGQAEELIYLKKNEVHVFETSSGVFYKVEGIMDPLGSDKIIHVPNFGDGLLGKSVLEKAAEDFAMQMNTRDYGSKFFGSGGKPIGIFIPKGTVTPAQGAQVVNNWEKAKNHSGDVALPFGWEYKELQVAPAEAGFLGASEASVADVARWTGVPIHKLFNMSAATRNNVEHQGIEFLQDTMSPIGAKFENEHNTKLLNLESEQDMYLEFNWDAYIKTDTATKAEAYAKYVQNAIKTPNQIRALNNDEAIPGADELFIQGATVPINLLKQMIVAKSSAPQARRKKMESKGQLTIEELIDMVNNVELKTNGNGKGH